MWNVGGYELESGEKKQVILHPNGRNYEIPTTLICGAKEGKTLLITAQIHAGEYNGSAAAARLAKEIEPEKLCGNVILMHCVNTSGFWQQQPRFIPEDHVNLNADYPGKEDGTIGQQIAAWFVKEVFPQVDFIADLHGGGMCEALAPCIFFPRAPKVTECALGAAKAMNVNYLLASSNAVGEYGYAANMLDIPGFILECGYGGLLREEWIQQVQECMKRLLEHFEMYAFGMPKLDTAGRKIYRNAEYLETAKRGVWYPAVQENQKVKKGELLGELGDFFGNVTERYYAAGDGTVIYYTAGMCVLEGDPLVAYGLEDSAESY
ncbi:MAG: succinylglutamate desuccinylase/aspartoacylase family protein [Eubacteriales bacterium]|nr:succinylglutamate desuccinylase/aspartoacylase family protein [Eubacteriales bacterium]